MTDPRLTHRAKIVAELTERLGNAFDGTDEDAGFLASQLEAEAKDLESLCVSLLREGRIRKAMAKGIRETVIADATARANRLEAFDDKVREVVANAMQEGGIQKIVSDDMTVSFRANKPSIAFACEPDLTIVDQYGGFIKMKEVYSWDKEAVLEWLDAGNTLSFAKLTNAAPSLTLRSK
jgi:hypothetical protein